MIKLSAVLLLIPSMAMAQYRPAVMSTISLQGISDNFNRAALWSNRKLDKYSNDVIYGSPTFNKPVTFKGTNTFTGGNSLYGSTTFFGDVIFVDTVTYTSTTTYQVQADLTALALSTGPLVRYGQWDTAYSWGNHASAGYLTVESDPVFVAHAANGITSTNISNWNTAYGWGNHALGGYALQTALDATNISTGTIAADVLTKVSKTGDTITGSLVVSANMTANMYYGNGSNLTGLVASGGIFELVSGNITPSIFSILTDSFFEYNAGGDIRPI